MPTIVVLPYYFRSPTDPALLRFQAHASLRIADKTALYPLDILTIHGIVAILLIYLALVVLEIGVFDVL